MWNYSEISNQPCFFELVCNSDEILKIPFNICAKFVELCEAFDFELFAEGKVVRLQTTLGGRARVLVGLRSNRVNLTLS